MYQQARSYSNSKWDEFNSEIVLISMSSFMQYSFNCVNIGVTVYIHYLNSAFFNSLSTFICNNVVKFEEYEDKCQQQLCINIYWLSFAKPLIVIHIRFLIIIYMKKMMDALYYKKIAEHK